MTVYDARWMIGDGMLDRHIRNDERSGQMISEQFNSHDCFFTNVVCHDVTTSSGGHEWCLFDLSQESRRRHHFFCSSFATVMFSNGVCLTVLTESVCCKMDDG